MSWMEITALLVAACAAGAMNAVAGGGTLITFPVLILFGVPPMVANATSTLSLVFGISGSLYGFRALLAEVRPWFSTFIPVSIAGGWLGSILLTRGSEQSFSRLVPYLVLFATLLFMIQGLVRRMVAHRVVSLEAPPSGRLHLAVALVFQFLVSVYGGYFGAGIGILMLATMGLMGLHHIHEMNAIKTVLGALINIVAAAYFVFVGLVVWPQAIVMTIGATLGYFLGSHMAQKISQQQVRNIVAVIGVSLSAVFFWREFLSR